MMKITVREYRALNVEARKVSLQKGQIAELREQIAQLQARAGLADEWREGNSSGECGFVLRHNPETCDDCYNAQLEKDRAAAERLAEVEKLDFAPNVPLWTEPKR